jgi:hypothetical protein
MLFEYRQQETSGPSHSVKPRLIHLITADPTVEFLSGQQKRDQTGKFSKTSLKSEVMNGKFIYVVLELSGEEIFC